MSEQNKTASPPKMVSPNEMMEAAKRLMLEGREPASREDWMRVANFVAHNTAPGLEVLVTRVMGKLYDMPLTEDELTQIAQHQAKVGKGGSL